MNDQRVFPNTPDAVALARHYVAGCVPDVSDEVRAQISLMVSELATNCVQHAATDFTVTVETTPLEIRVEVIDTGGGEPMVRSPEPTEPSGRGLRIVRELADSFGVDRAERGLAGKTVWFVVRTAEPRSGAAIERGTSTAGSEPGAQEHVATEASTTSDVRLDAPRGATRR